GRYGATSWSPWVAARATVRAGRRRGAPVGGRRRLRSPRPASSYNGAHLVRCTVRARYGATSSSAWVVARAGVRAGGWPGDAPAGRAGPGWGTRAPGTGQAPAPPQPRLANSYNRAQLVRCTVRARYGATSSRPRRIHGGSTAEPGRARPDPGQAAPGPRQARARASLLGDRLVGGVLRLREGVGDGDEAGEHVGEVAAEGLETGVGVRAERCGDRRAGGLLEERRGVDALLVPVVGERLLRLDGGRERGAALGEERLALRRADPAQHLGDLVGVLGVGVAERGDRVHDTDAA